MAVEQTLDAAHAPDVTRIDRLSRQEEARSSRREKSAPASAASTRRARSTICGGPFPTGPAKSAATLSTERRRHLLGLPQENLLYFLEKAAPRLQPWQRELLRIVRHIAQYFYPQGQTRS